MQHQDRVIVAGAGPVGAIMTLALVKKGIPVTLLEQLPDAAVYPDSGKVGIWTGNDADSARLFRIDTAVDYWEGEA